jgi:hypothetical protein
LIVDPTKRLTADQILLHPWIVGDSTPRGSLANVTQRMREYNAKRRLKKAGYLIIAANRFKNILKLK